MTRMSTLTSSKGGGIIVKNPIKAEERVPTKVSSKRIKSMRTTVGILTSIDVSRFL